MTLGGGIDVAKEAVKGLSGSPALLLIILLNIAMLGSILYVGSIQAAERKEIRQDDQAMIQLLTEMCGRKL